MRHDSSYLMDALRALDDLEQFMSQTNRERFMTQPLEQSFVFHRLVIIGEATVQLAREFQLTHPEVPWASLIALRNRLVHAYFDLDQALLWDAVDRGMSSLRGQYAQILQDEFPGSHSTSET